MDRMSISIYGNCLISQKSFENEFYKINYIRQNIYPTFQAIGFPPLYPFLLYIFNLVFEQQINSYLYVNFISVFLFAYFIRKNCILNTNDSSLWGILVLAIFCFSQFSWKSAAEAPHPGASFIF